jgi:hypothetical protein
MRERSLYRRLMPEQVCDGLARFVPGERNMVVSRFCSMPLFDAQRAAEISPETSLAFIVLCPAPDNGTLTVSGAERSTVTAVCGVDVRTASSGI